MTEIVIQNFFENSLFFLKYFLRIILTKEIIKNRNPDRTEKVIINESFEKMIEMTIKTIPIVKVVLGEFSFVIVKFEKVIEWSFES